LPQPAAATAYIELTPKWAGRRRAAGKFRSSKPDESSYPKVQAALPVGNRPLAEAISPRRVTITQSDRLSGPNLSNLTRDRRSRRRIVNIVGPNVQRTGHAFGPHGENVGGYRLDPIAPIREPTQQIA
jgi:hypothetical protein